MFHTVTQNEGHSTRTTHITVPQSVYPRLSLHRAALKIAERGRPVFPCKPAPDKSPLTMHGFKDASTNPGVVNGFWNSHHGASIGMPTGRASGISVMDVDRLQALEELGFELPDTMTASTPRGGHHYYFRHVEGITNSPGGLPDGIDIRGEGGYVLVPPSPGYEVVSRAPIADFPPELLELIRSRRREEGGAGTRRTRTRAVGGPSSTEPIPEGCRNRTLFFWALDRKDEGRSHDEVFDLTLTENDARCTPPLEQEEVEKIVKSAMRYPIRSGTPTPELIEACEKLDEDLQRRYWKGRGGGGHTDRDLKRTLIDLSIRYGRLQPDGSIEVSASVRSLALAASTSFVTISGAATKRLAKSGQIRKLDRGRTAAEAATWVLLPPQPFNTQHKSSSGSVLCVKELRPINKRVWEWETPTWRRFGWVGKGAAGVLYHLEGAGGELDEAELADRFGISVGDLRRRGYLDRLLEQRLIEQRGDHYSLVEGYLERVDEIKNTPYSTIRQRMQRRMDYETGRTVCDVMEVGSVRSEVERDAVDEAKYEEQRKAWQKRHEPEENPFHRDDPEADGVIEDLQKVEETSPTDQTEPTPPTGQTPQTTPTAPTAPTPQQAMFQKALRRPGSAAAKMLVKYRRNPDLKTLEFLTSACLVALGMDADNFEPYLQVAAEAADGLSEGVA